jgi:hypothetical protein
MQTRRLGEFEVSALGLGCMNLSHAYGTPPPEDEAGKLLLRGAGPGRHALRHRRAVRLRRQREPAGPGAGAAPRPLRAGQQVRAARRGRQARDRRPARDDPLVGASRACSACAPTGIDLLLPAPLGQAGADRRQRGRTGRPGAAQARCAASACPRCRPATLARAHAVHPIARVQTEYSLWTRNAGDRGAGCLPRQLGAAFVAFSPLARAFLTGTLQRRLGERWTPKDLRRGMPRFAPEPPIGRNLGPAAGLRGPGRARPAARRPSWPWPGCCSAASTSCPSPAPAAGAS